MAPNSKYMKLMLVTLAGVATLCLVAIVFYVVRSWLVTHGYEVPSIIYVAVIGGLLGGVYGIFAKQVLREVQRLGGSGESGK